MFQEMKRLFRAMRDNPRSRAIAVAAYEVLRQWDYEGMQTEGQLTAFDWDSAPGGGTDQGGDAT